jgi:hypothetical protein
LAFYREILSALILATVAAVLVAPAGRGSDSPSSTKILAAAGQYVQQFEHAFAVVIADETYTQDVHVQGDPSAARRMQSEVLFMWVPEDRTWLTVRSVLAVNGKRVPDSTARLERALQEPLADRESRLHRLAEESARFNVGVIHRNFNNPTLVLQFLDPSYQSRFSFTIQPKDREERKGGIFVQKVMFAEVQRPTIIRDGDQDVVSTGALWARVSDGTIVRTTLAVTDHKTDTQAFVAVDYRHDTRLDMWVPSHMEEHYQSRVVEDHLGALDSKVSRLSEITCLADYSHFRRFETSGRVLVPK